MYAITTIESNRVNREAANVRSVSLVALSPDIRSHFSGNCIWCVVALHCVNWHGTRWGGFPAHGVDWLGLVGWLVSLAFEGTNFSFVSLSVWSVWSSKLEMLLVYSLMELEPSASIGREGPGWWLFNHRSPDMAWSHNQRTQIPKGSDIHYIAC